MKKAIDGVNVDISRIIKEPTSARIVIKPNSDQYNIIKFYI